MTTALVVIDMQHDFLDQQGWFARHGFDVRPLWAIVPVVGHLLAAARATGMPVLHTRQGNAADLADLPVARRQAHHPIGTPGPLGRGLIRGEPGWEIVPELAPLPDETVIDKPGFSAFAGTNLDTHLGGRGIGRLLLTGVTANVCVLATLLAAADLGYEVAVVSDAVASVSEETTATVLDLVRYQGGLLGQVVAAADAIAGTA